VDAVPHVDWPHRSRRGLSLVELLLVVAVLAVLLGFGAIQGRAIAQGSSERAAVRSVQQAVWQGATLAAARGFRTALDRQGPELIVRRLSNGEVLRRYALDPNVVLDLQDGRVLVFAPPGTIVPETLDALPSPIVMVAGGTTYRLQVSMIGEVRVR